MSSLSRKSFLQKAGLGAAIFTGTGIFTNVLANFSNGDKPLNIALCGLGRYAGIVAEGLTQCRFARLNGIITGTPSKATDWQNRYKFSGSNIYDYQTADNIASNNAIDLVYITLPNALHKDMVLRMAKARKHIIVEKPMALNAADCQEMIAACEKAGVSLAVGYRLHFEPYHKEIMRLGQQKILGQIRLIEASLGYKGSSPNEWRLKKAMSGGGPLMNIGLYCVQAARYALGEEPVAITAQFGPVTRPELFAEVEESISWQMVFPSGAVATCNSSYNANIDRFYAAADEGFIDMNPALSYGPFNGRTNLGEMVFPTINQQAAQIDAIASCILHHQPLPDHISGKEGFKDMLILDSIYQAAGKRTKVNLEIPA
jgi:predicted dehydrogenase